MFSRLKTLFCSHDDSAPIERYQQEEWHEDFQDGTIEIARGCIKYRCDKCKNVYLVHGVQLKRNKITGEIL